jgi:glycerol uptake facilitator-like aquaporin
MASDKGEVDDELLNNNAAAAEFANGAENDYDAGVNLKPRFVFAEFLGSLFFTLFAAGSVLSTGTLTFQFNLAEMTPGRLLGISLANGTAFGALVYVATSLLDNSRRRQYERDNRNAEKKLIGASEYPVGHFNPAITFACCISSPSNNAGASVISVAAALWYIAAQLVGSIIGAVLLTILIPNASSTQLGSTVPGEGASAVNALVMEAMLTFVLVFVVLIFNVRREQNSDDEEGLVRKIAPLSIGFTVMSANFVGASVSGASMNPARSFGTAVVSGTWNEHWVYWVGPFMGAGLAAIAYGAFRKVQA